MPSPKNYSFSFFLYKKNKLFSNLEIRHPSYDTSWKRKNFYWVIILRTTNKRPIFRNNSFVSLLTIKITCKKEQETRKKGKERKKIFYNNPLFFLKGLQNVYFLLLKSGTSTISLNPNTFNSMYFNSFTNCTN